MAENPMQNALTLRFLSHMKSQSRMVPGLVTQWLNGIVTPAQHLCDSLEFSSHACKMVLWV